MNSIKNSQSADQTQQLNQTAHDSSISSTSSLDSMKKPTMIGNDTEEAPEGGWGWVVVGGCFIVMGTSFGMINSYGEFQKYYLEKFPTESQSVLTLMGSLQAFSMYLVSVPAAIMLQKLGPRNAVLISAVIISFSFMMTSLCTEVWQLALAQGVVFGMGTSMPVLVCYSVPQQWFKKLRATAIGIVSSGSSIGGIVWPLAIQRLIKQVGFAWTNRIIGFIYLPLLVIAALSLKTRDTSVSHGTKNQSDPTSDPEQTSEQNLPSAEQNTNTQNFQDEKVSPVRKNWLRRNVFHSKFMIDWTVLKDYRFCIILLANFVGFFTLFIPLFFISSYAGLIKVKPAIQNNILTITNAASVVGRIIPGVAGDKIGRLNAFIIASVLSGVFVLAFWLPAKNDTLLLLTGIFFGLSSGAFVALPPAVIGQLFGPNGVNSRLSLYMLVCAPGSLVGTIIGGSFLPTGSDSVGSGTKGYPQLIVFSGVLFLGCAFFLVLARLCFSRKLFAFV